MFVGGAMPNDPVDPRNDEETLLDDATVRAIPRRFKVIMHNDDFTTMEYVIEALTLFFHKSPAEATHLMLTIHKKGAAVAGIYPRDVAETKVVEVTRHARERGHPLKLTTEPE